MSRPETVVVARTSDSAALAYWLTALDQAGVPAASYEEGIGAALGGGLLPGHSAFAVIVPRERLSEARTVIAECGGASALTPVPARGSARIQHWATIAVAAGVVALALVAAGLAVARAL